MLFWPAGVAFLVVWLVFRDPALDYRVLVAGAVLPDVVDGTTGGAGLLHTLVASAVLLVAVMLLTRGRRRARRRWLALPLGTFAHLVADGAWLRTRAFWWPFLGGPLRGPLPAVEHGPTVLVLEELVGLAILAWAWKRFGMGERANRAALARTGHLPRHLVG